MALVCQATRLTEVRKEEYELLEAQSIPLRNYLMQHVMPTLTQSLIDCCKARPDDPIDYIVSASSFLCNQWLGFLRFLFCFSVCLLVVVLVGRGTSWAPIFVCE